MKKRKISVVTGTRAEYGLLYWLMKEIENDPSLELQLIVTGMHLSPEFGLTYKVIEEDGWTIHEKVEMLLSSDTPVGITKSLGIATIGFADALDRLKPDILILLGDRYEILAAAQAALVANIPIAHIHGGELTEGAIDDSIRHGITKFSNIHFTATEGYRRRVIQMGEKPSSVFNVGAPGLDHLKKLKLLTKEELEKELDFLLGEINFLITYHPVTRDEHGPKKAMEALFEALERFAKAKVFFTKPNSDAGNRVIGQMIDDFAAKHPTRVKAYTSLGQLRYLSLMSQVDLVIGNSSSGIIEAPALRKPTINMGDRQKGRLKALSVIDCLESAESIAQAIEKALSPEFRTLISSQVPPYGEGNVSYAIKEHLKQLDLDYIKIKEFYDLDKENAAEIITVEDY